MPQQLIVGISDCKFSDDSKATILTYALGSCVGVALYDPVSKVGGLCHVMLPKSRLETSENPYMFADTGVLALAREVVRIGGRKDRLTAKIAGGANMLVCSPLLDVGRKNSEVVLQTLKDLGIAVIGRSLGGVLGRSMYLHLESGRVSIRMLGGGEETL